MTKLILTFTDTPRSEIEQIAEDCTRNGDFPADDFEIEDDEEPVVATHLILNTFGLSGLFEDRLPATDVIESRGAGTAIDLVKAELKHPEKLTWEWFPTDSVAVSKVLAADRQRAVVLCVLVVLGS
jgi:hypothetical protein